MDSKEQASGTIHGISLTSFLQVLEQERRSSTLVVSYGDEEGYFFFHEGQLVDADYNGTVGLTAAYSLLAWEYPMCTVTKGEDRIHRIKEPLASILMNSAAKKDEIEEPATTGDREMTDGRVTTTIQGPPALVRLVDKLIDIPGVKHYCLLGRQGKMIACSSKNQQFGDFIAYSILSGMQMCKVLEAKTLRRVRIKLKDGEMLLIIHSSGMIIGLLLDKRASESEVLSQLRQAIKQK